ncbi:hypothetical protein FACS1894191_3440 [Clostridia bacterium]|nr:hypothetical protein FACS1894191_3440 [Clostridia bacterium]
MLYCGDCGYKMYLQQGVKTPERKHAYTCGNYRNRARNDFCCTTHYIRKSVIEELVLNDLRRVLAYVREHKSGFIRKVNEYSDKESKKALERERKELDRAEARMKELDMVFRKLYEDNALGRLSDQQFTALASGYEDEKSALAERVKVLGRDISDKKERRADADRFLKIVEQYSDIQKLDYENVHEFIDRILIYDIDRETETRKVEIFYSFIGQVDSGDEPTEATSYVRRERKNIKSYVI